MDLGIPKSVDIYFSLRIIFPKFPTPKPDAADPQENLRKDFLKVN